MYHGGDDVGAIVADIGSYSTRVGYAGDDTPRTYMPTAVGVLESEGSVPLFDLSYRPDLHIESPVRDGLVVDWDMFEKLWEHSLGKFYSRGGLAGDVDSPPVLMAEKPYTSMASRHRMCELMFEKHRPPALFLSKDAALAAYATGKTGGLVVDVGASGTLVTPVVDGWVEARGMARSIVGGRLVDAFIRADLLDNPLTPLFRLHKTVGTDALVITKNTSVTSVTPSYNAFMNLEVARDLKEVLAKTADSTLYEGDARYAGIPTTSYELPDGTAVEVNIQRFQIAELLIDPSLIEAQGGYQDLIDLYSRTGQGVSAGGGGEGGAEGGSVFRMDVDSSSAGASAGVGAGAGAGVGVGKRAGRMHAHAYDSPLGASSGSLDGIPKVVCDAVMRSDPELQTTLLANMVLTGGCTAIEGLSERVKAEGENKPKTRKLEI
ncbi:actin family [Ochromonadaceae sp. CCMP2298]|nr:actin family [Ochromonadaceae sp. CCMP2298]